jgi:ferric-dicitrate binding protein FerR (iron transport regulator)
MGELSKQEELLTKWLNNELSAEELKIFESTKDFNTYKQIAEETRSWQVQDLDMASSYDQLKRKKAQNSSRSNTVKMQPAPWKMAVAASVLLLSTLLIYTLFIKSDITTYSTVAGQTKEIELPGGSIVQLNTNSQISFEQKKWTRKRKVKLRGNAYFKVKKGKPFTVESPQGQVEVKGTAFEINDGTGYYSVRCTEGHVQVAMDLNDLHELVAGQALTHSTGEETKISNIDQGQFPSWSNSKNKFIDAPLSQVFDAMKGVFEVTFEFNDIDLERKFTGEFLHSDIEIALKMVCTPMQIDFTVSDDKIALKPAK